MNLLFRSLFSTLLLLGVLACAEAKPSTAAHHAWYPDAALVKKLGPEVALDHCAFRPPVGFRQMKTDASVPGRTLWTFASQDHFSGVATDLYLVTVNSQGHPTGWTRDGALASAVKSLEHDLTNTKVTPPEQGYIGNLPATRCYVKGDLKLNPQQQAQVGRSILKKHLFVYVIGDGNFGITMIAEDIAPYNTQTLPLLEASVLTMRWTPSP